MSRRVTQTFVWWPRLTARTGTAARTEDANAQPTLAAARPPVAIHRMQVRASDRYPVHTRGSPGSGVIWGPSRVLP
ncbi:hypothetical protein GCM10009539_58410 [Cryptosporangium japonicum]|uniref:Secreted protein n=1 Tax=Cryptosporangium japonicum TaxID=80872 RepID=A0ABN0UXD8_9ACTN